MCRFDNPRPNSFPGILSTRWYRRRRQRRLTANQSKPICLPQRGGRHNELSLLIPHHPIQYVYKQSFSILHGLFNTDDFSRVFICDQGVDWVCSCFRVFVGVTELGLFVCCVEMCQPHGGPIHYWLAACQVCLDTPTVFGELWHNCNGLVNSLFAYFRQPICCTWSKSCCFKNIFYIVGYDNIRHWN